MARLAQTATRLKPSTERSPLNWNKHSQRLFPGGLTQSTNARFDAEGKHYVSVLNSPQLRRWPVCWASNRRHNNSRPA